MKRLMPTAIKVRLLTMAIIALLFCPSFSFAFPGEIFKIETTGKEYCGDFDVTAFNASNNVDLWVQLDSDTQLTVSLTSNFAGGTTFPMFGLFYLVNSKSAAFIGGVLFVDDSYATIQGTATFDKFGSVTKLAGQFVQNGVLQPGCFSSGKFKSVQKLN